MALEVLEISKSHIKQKYIYLFLLLALSGNPFFRMVNTTSELIFSVFVTILMLKHLNYFRPKKDLKIFFFLSFFISIFVLQQIVLGFVSWPGALGFLLKILLGYIVIRFLGDDFKIYYFNLIYFLCLVSLVGYLWNSLGFDIPALFQTARTNMYFDNSGRNIIFFHQKGSGLRNSGMFWEPGAFACYIILAFLLYLGNIRHLLIEHRMKVVVIILALITTYSTTGYLVFIMVCFFTIYLEYSKKIGVLIVPVGLIFLGGAFVLYENTDFLKQKLELQFESASQRNEMEFSPDRIGALKFDLHYIKKRPLIGNGLHSKTRYADHPWLQGEKLGHGNGFSNFLATMGILSLIFYSSYILKYNSRHSWIFLITIYALMQGEQLMNYPLFLSLPFIFIYENYFSRSSYLSQQEGENLAVPASSF